MPTQTTCNCTLCEALNKGAAFMAQHGGSARGVTCWLFSTDSRYSANLIEQKFVRALSERMGGRCVSMMRKRNGSVFYGTA